MKVVPSIKGKAYHSYLKLISDIFNIIAGKRILYVMIVAEKRGGHRTGSHGNRGSLSIVFLPVIEVRV